MVDEDAAMNIMDRLIDMDRKSPRRIVVIGDAMKDIYIHGHIEECSEGCPKLVAQELDVTVPGGAFNAGNTLTKWKAKTILLPPLNGPEPDIIKVRFMVDGKCVFRYDDDNNEVTNEMRLMSLGLLEIQEPHAVLLSDYDKGVLTPEFIAAIARSCQRRRIPCVVDVKRPPEVYRHEQVILKGNKMWAQKYGAPDVTTQGPLRPIMYGKIMGPDLPPVECVNHVGAGDCFAAHMTLALAYGFSLKEATVVAHSAGRVYVQHQHNRPPLPDEIRQDFLR